MGTNASSLTHNCCHLFDYLDEKHIFGLNDSAVSLCDFLHVLERFGKSNGLPAAVALLEASHDTAKRAGAAIFKSNHTSTWAPLVFVMPFLADFYKNEPLVLALLSAFPLDDFKSVFLQSCLAALTKKRGTVAAKLVQVDEALKAFNAEHPTCVSVAAPAADA
jgi:hypothetical protein